MSEHKISITHPDVRDIPVLEQLWMDVFGDSPELIEAFFDVFPPMVYGWIVCDWPEILTSAYLLHGNLMLRDGEITPAAYVYAVATPEVHRGKGYAGLLMRHFANLAKERSLLLYTHPAEDSLYSWYKKTMLAAPTGGAEQTLIRRTESAAQLPQLSRLTAEQYGVLRERNLQARQHVVLSDSFLRLQEHFLHDNGGGFFAAGNCCVAIDRTEHNILIKELLGPEAEKTSAIQSALNAMDAEHAILTAYNTQGKPQIAFTSECPIGDADWGLLLD